MNALEKYKVVEALGPLMDTAEWCGLLYEMEEYFDERIICMMVKYLAAKKPESIKTAWPLGVPKLKLCLENQRISGGDVLAQDEVDALLRALSGDGV